MGHQYLALPPYARVRHQNSHALNEIATVAQSLEADDVVLKQRIHESHAPGELDKQIQRRKRNMQEKPDPRPHTSGAQLRADVHEVVVVHPHEILAGALLCDGLCILRVDLAIRPPVEGIEVAQRLQVMEQRPDNLVGKTQVKVGDLLLAQPHGLQQIAGGAAGALGGHLHFGVCLVGACPSDPHAASIAQHWQQRRHQTARAGLRRPNPVRASLEDIGQPV